MVSFMCDEFWLMFELQILFFSFHYPSWPIHRILQPTCERWRGCWHARTITGTWRAMDGRWWIWHGWATVSWWSLPGWPQLVTSTAYPVTQSSPLRQRKWQWWKQPVCKHIWCEPTDFGCYLHERTPLKLRWFCQPQPEFQHNQQSKSTHFEHSLENTLAPFTYYDTFV